MRAKHILGAIRDSIVAQADRAASVADAAMDVMAQGNIPRVPLFSASVKSLQFCDAVAERRYKRNVEAFVKALSDALSRESIDEAIEQIATVSETAEDFVDTLMQVLTAGEKPLKCQLMGRLFAAFAEGKISYDQMHNVMLIVLNASIPSLESLPTFVQALRRKNGVYRYRIPQEGLLYSAGLGSRYGDRFSLDEFGKILAEHGFQEAPVVPRPR